MFSLPVQYKMARHLNKSSISWEGGFLTIEEVSMKWMDRPSVTEMERGGVYEIEIEISSIVSKPNNNQAKRFFAKQKLS